MRLWTMAMLKRRIKDRKPEICYACFIAVLLIVACSAFYITIERSMARDANVDQRNHDEAYRRGVRAYHSGVPAEANPNRNHGQSVSWLDGWLDTKDGK